ncbi:MAG: hypothetical protein K0M45_01110, partial [Candidatus Paracaedibacteraceae bacterium]|nr:hypothetical protein [Candidatus Paracaedibacteraceae bacterium]
MAYKSIAQLIKSEQIFDLLNTGGSRVLRILSNFILIAIISRLTPNSLLAEYFIYSSIFIPLTIIASMGIGITAIAQIAKDGKLVFGHLISIHKSFLISS